MGSYFKISFGNLCLLIDEFKAFTFTVFTGKNYFHFAICMWSLKLLFYFLCGQAVTQ